MVKNITTKEREDESTKINSNRDDAIRLDSNNYHNCIDSFSLIPISDERLEIEYITAMSDPRRI